MIDDDESGLSCCSPIIEENGNLKKLKPILIIGVIIFGVLLIVDVLIDRHFYLYYFVLGITLLLMVVNRCYFAFWYYTLFLVVYIFSSLLSKIGIYIQRRFDNLPIKNFCVYLFAFIFVHIMFYFAFRAYKEMKYLYLMKLNTSQQLDKGILDGTLEANNDYNTNYNSKSNNNANNNNKSGFKAFSGKGYIVGGS